MAAVPSSRSYREKGNCFYAREKSVQQQQVSSPYMATHRIDNWGSQCLELNAEVAEGGPERRKRFSLSLLKHHLRKTAHSRAYALLKESISESHFNCITSLGFTSSRTDLHPRMYRGNVNSAR